jgi:hypothetical protein
LQEIAGPRSNLARRYGAEASQNSKPFNLGEEREMRNWMGFCWHPLLGHVYAVWSTETTDQLLALVFDYNTGALIGTEQWPAMSTGPLGIYGFASGQGTSQGIYTVSKTGVVLWRVHAASATTLYGVDQPATTGSTTFTPTVIGPAQGYDEATDWTFDEIDVAFEGNAVDTGALVKVDYLTDQAHYSTLMAAQQTSTAYGATYAIKEQRASFGINGHGAWIRARIQLSSTSRMALKGWSVVGFPVEDTVGVA